MLSEKPLHYAAINMRARLLYGAEADLQPVAGHVTTAVRLLRANHLASAVVGGGYGETKESTDQDRR